jgi:peptidoglycan/xylan/chitin deacetylase (PgdA/CDA1 family)
LRVTLTFHAERLGTDEVWLQVSQVLAHLERYGIQATFFCVAPVHPYYRNQPSFSEATWAGRINEIAKRGHVIGQHTHFYNAGRQEKTVDVASENMYKRLEEDRHWLQMQGFVPTGFVGGGWTISADIFRFLLMHDYQYDCSAHSFDLAYLKGRGQSLSVQHPFLLCAGGDSLLEIPTTASIINAVRGLLPLSGQKNHLDVKSWGRYTLIYLHDYDLLNLKFRAALRLALQWYRIRGEEFVSMGQLHEKLSGTHLPVHTLEEIQL